MTNIDEEALERKKEQIIENLYIWLDRSEDRHSFNGSSLYAKISHLVEKGINEEKTYD